MATPRRPGRPKSQLPECYHEGFLEKRSFKDKVARKLWTSLCGNSLFFFNSSKDNDYVEKVDLSDFVKLTDDSSHDRNLDAARLLLQLKQECIQLTAPTLEARELWKGFLYSVVELKVPSYLNLLPGQIHMLMEVVDKEKMRRKPLPSIPASAVATKTVPTSSTPAQNPYLTLLSEMPACYHQVSRGESELILDRNQEKGNLLLRPGRDGASFAVTTRQDLNGAVFRHYRVARCNQGGFSIAVENPIHCETLHDVITCLVEKTGGIMIPLVLEEAYEKSITFVDDNRESGEKMVVCASNNSGPPLPAASKPAPRRALKPQTAIESESPYLIPADISFSDEEADEGYEGAFDPVPAQKQSPGRSVPHQISMPDGLKISPGGALLPPSYPISSNRSHSLSETPKTRPKPHQAIIPPRPAGDTLPMTLSEELREKLKKRQAVLE